MSDTMVSPSILSADFAKLADEIAAIEEAGANFIHVDVMDGHFVENITMGPDIIKCIKRNTKLPIDTHLMIERPEKYISQFASAGSDIITIHPECSCPHTDKILEQIRENKCLAGISLIPSTHPNTLEYLYDKLDLIMVMTVNPGFCGQKFIHSQVSKISHIRQRIANRNIMLQVDGGINEKTAKIVIDAGANVLVAGSFIFNHPEKDYKKNIELLKRDC